MKIRSCSIATFVLALCFVRACFAQEQVVNPPTEFLAASGLEFRLIEPGVFMMGNDASVEEIMAKYPGGQDRSLVLSARRRVTLTKRFYLAKRLVTVGDFRRFVEATGYKTTAEQKGVARGLDANGAWIDAPGLNWQEPGFQQTSKNPVVCVSYYDAVAYVNWLNATCANEPELGGKPRYVLPTESEWEYAARAGSTTEFFWGDEAADGAKYLNAADESGSSEGRKWTEAFPFNDGYVASSPVGSFEPNAWGLYDMLGNVWEWCADRFGAYGTAPVVDPQGAAFGDYRVLRGGGWDAAPALARCAYRGANLPDACNTNYGFRVALVLPEPIATPTPPPPAPPAPLDPTTPPAPVETPIEEPVLESSPEAEPTLPEPTSPEPTTPAPAAPEPEVPSEENALRQQIVTLGFKVMEGRRLIGDVRVGRVLDSIETDDYRAASQALKSGEPLDEILLKKIQLAALLATLGDGLDESTAPNFEYLPSVARDRVLLLGGLAFLGQEFLVDDEATDDGEDQDEK
ncbi:MAG: SUMF1/EgtB/PvdO family nonheme iron enzyme [Thermoguttaceae bacterium]|nr:SUMF1/EgtB/PvdO family nonheme iron enzyme [Thermoguttaceae bacterium]